MKKYLNKNVYEAAQERIKECFDRFDNVIVSFSGGKDSGVCLNMCYDYAKARGLLHKLVIMHVDFEAQYQATTDYVTETFAGYPEIKKFWLCLPISAQCAVNMSNEGYWFPWCRDERDIWVRDMPDSPHVIHEGNVPFPFKERWTDQETMSSLASWWQEQHGSTAVIIGIRADESLRRQAIFTSGQRVNMYNGLKYTVQQGQTTKVYPIYDWAVEDIWTANARFGWPYNRLYDLFYMAGLSLNDMRVASPFNDCAAATLKVYKAVEPATWGKLISRVNGVNFSGIYGGTTAMGWRSITKPSHFTWKQYCEFLISTLPENLKQNYQRHLDVSIKFWREKGGALDSEIISEIEGTGTEFINEGAVNPLSDKDVLRFEEYPDDMEIQAFAAVPSYKRMCVCILKNDYFCKYMGFAQTKEQVMKRCQALEKYKNL